LGGRRDDGARGERVRSNDIALAMLLAMLLVTMLLVTMLLAAMFLATMGRGAMFLATTGRGARSSGITEFQRLFDAACNHIGKVTIDLLGTLPGGDKGQNTGSDQEVQLHDWSVFRWRKKKKEKSNRQGSLLYTS
jgi:hypothetical protein